MADKNETIRLAAAQVAENYQKSDILMYGDALRLPSRLAVIEIIRDFQKILFPAYYGDRDLLKLPPEQYSALLMDHVYDKLLRQLELVMPEGEEGARRAAEVCGVMMERLPSIQEMLRKDLTANYNGDPAASSRQEVVLSYPGMFAIFIYRIAHELYLEQVPMLPRIMTSTPTRRRASTSTLARPSASISPSTTAPVSSSARRRSSATACSSIRA